MIVGMAFSCAGFYSVGKTPQAAAALAIVEPSAAACGFLRFRRCDLHEDSLIKERSAR